MIVSYIEVKNFERFQHYKDRNPPWIKLYNELLDDYAFGRLPDASKWLAVGLWLLASRYENRIPNDAEWIGRRINANVPVDIVPLISAGFVKVSGDASKTLAGCEQTAMPETEAEKSREREEVEKKNANGSSVLKLHTKEPLEAQIDACIIATNRGMHDNPMIGDACHPIPIGHASRQHAADWLNEGVPPDVAAATCYERAKAYKPTDRRKQITTLAYFNGAVRDAADMHRAKNGAPPAMPASAPKPDPVAKMKETEPELYAACLAELERYPWWADTIPQIREKEIRQLMRERKAGAA